MALNAVKFTCTSLAGTNKVGNLKMDANGYRLITLGALNVFNSAGQFYEYEGAKELFTSSSSLMRRIGRGVLKAECGHPKKEVGMSDDAFARRCLSIYESETCAHIKEVYLDFDNVKDEKGQPVIAIMGWVKASGVKGDFLERSLANPDENVCFSIRAFTDDYRDKGIVKRILREIVTWDYVNEPGIAFAEKFKSPALELYDVEVTRGQLERATTGETYGIATESVIMTAQQLFSAMGWDTPKGSVIARPSYTSWK